MFNLKTILFKYFTQLSSITKNHILKYKTNLIHNLLTTKQPPLNLIFKLFQIYQIITSLNTKKKKKNLINYTNYYTNTPNKNNPYNTTLYKLNKLPTN